MFNFDEKNKEKKSSVEPDQFINSIRTLASEALKHLPGSSVAYHEAQRRTKRPVDYMRCSEFDSGYFDRAISISVIEHVAPEIGGDVKALSEIKRVLIPVVESNSTLTFLFLWNVRNLKKFFLKSDIDIVAACVKG